MGHARLEAFVLCNLGIVRDAMGEPNDARNHYEAALVVARRLGDRRLEGQFLGYLGCLYARMKRFDDARRDSDAGFELLRSASDSFNLAVLLCGRAEMEWMSGATERARIALSEAEDISLKIGGGPGSELALALDRARARLEDTPN